ncbi:Sec-independent protein translocase TatB [Campylobacter sp. MIT 99-7217]|uniref:Sec-independent protein translocase protein TatB n=1 Tax=Campylobacter sp. MIT 99-7217 TaxID=535091 RepID=UPI0011588779|nr:Sec-independent protein translocase protein TatB [Campylobacter sp. MIT 99-7217]TQR33871.1 Sec-independent protein translocase TatB [Campylobacter sp. MIT 99-7217]
MSMGEIIVILVVAILVLGPEKLPSTAVQIAKILRALKRQVDDAKESIEKELRISELKEEAKKYKDEMSEYNQNIRKKLSFEEFDELKENILKEKKAIDTSLEEIAQDLKELGQKEEPKSEINTENLASSNTRDKPKLVSNLDSSSQNKTENQNV